MNLCIKLRKIWDNVRIEIGDKVQVKVRYKVWDKDSDPIKDMLKNIIG